MKSALRWLAVFPVYVIVIMLASILVPWIRNEPSSPERLSWLGMIPFAITSAIVGGLSAWAAVSVAPRGRRWVALIVVGFWVVSIAAGTYLLSSGKAEYYSWKDLIVAISLATGSALVAWNADDL